MKGTKGYFLILLYLGTLLPQTLSARDDRIWRERYNNNQEPGILGEFVLDILRLHGKLFTWDSYKVLVGFFPPFIAARMADERIHCCFYDREHHKNVNRCQNGAKQLHGSVSHYLLLVLVL